MTEQQQLPEYVCKICGASILGGILCPNCMEQEQLDGAADAIFEDRQPEPGDVDELKENEDFAGDNELPNCLGDEL